MCYMCIVYDSVCMIIISSITMYMYSTCICLIYAYDQYINIKSNILHSSIDEIHELEGCLKLLQMVEWLSRGSQCPVSPLI